MEQQLRAGGGGRLGKTGPVNGGCAREEAHERGGERGKEESVNGMFYAGDS